MLLLPLLLLHIMLLALIRPPIISQINWSAIKIVRYPSEYAKRLKETILELAE